MGLLRRPPLCLSPPSPSSSSLGSRLSSGVVSHPWLSPALLLGGLSFHLRWKNQGQRGPVIPNPVPTQPWETLWAEGGAQALRPALHLGEECGLTLATCCPLEAGGGGGTGDGDALAPKYSPLPKASCPSTARSPLWCSLPKASPGPTPQDIFLTAPLPQPRSPSLALKALICYFMAPSCWGTMVT